MPMLGIDILFPGIESGPGADWMPRSWFGSSSTGIRNKLKDAGFSRDTEEKEKPMVSKFVKKSKWILLGSLLSISTVFVACQDASEPVAAKSEVSSGKTTTPSALSQVKGGTAGECDGFDILRTPLKMDVEAMPCAQPCLGSHNPVCTAEGLTYPNTCFAEMAKAEIVSQGECQ
jgi:hypothetical protein